MTKHSTQIKEYLAQIPLGKPFSSNVLRHLATIDNLRQILNRLVKKGYLKRIARGLFVKIQSEDTKLKKPRSVIKPAALLPTEQMLNALVTFTGETIAIHGAEATRQLGLSTQMPMRPVFYTSGNTRTIKLAGKTVKLHHANPSKLILAGTLSGLVISALNYLGKNQINESTIDHIHKKIGQKQFKKLLSDVSHMPPWMAEIFFYYQNHSKKNESL